MDFHCGVIFDGLCFRVVLHTGSNMQQHIEPMSDLLVLSQLMGVKGKSKIAILTIENLVICRCTFTFFAPIDQKVLRYKILNTSIIIQSIIPIASENQRSYLEPCLHCKTSVQIHISSSQRQRRMSSPKTPSTSSPVSVVFQSDADYEAVITYIHTKYR